MDNSLLMIFVKNPLLGKVKQRLAATIGDEKALAVYNYLLRHTRATCYALYPHKAVFYSSRIDEDDLWENDEYQKFVQIGDDLGERMCNAFEQGFSLGYGAIVLIGSDCLELNERILLEAFEHLADHDIVIGPTSDGGYYLIGMKKLYKDVFRNKSWSTESLFEETLQSIETLGLHVHCLPRLSDIDTEEDLGELKYLV